MSKSYDVYVVDKSTHKMIKVDESTTLNKAKHKGNFHAFNLGLKRYYIKDINGDYYGYNVI